LIATSPIYDIFESHTNNVMWVMDDYVSQPELIGVNPSIVKHQFARLVSKANHIICASHVLGENYAHDDRCHIIENGADENIFHFPTSQIFSHDDLLPHGDFVVYVGGINDR